jgi:hypothetical protein
MASTRPPVSAAELETPVPAVTLVGRESPRTLWRIAARRLRRNAPALAAMAFLVAVHRSPCSDRGFPWDLLFADPITRLWAAVSASVGHRRLDGARTLVLRRVSLAVGFVAMAISVSSGRVPSARGAIRPLGGRLLDAVH